MPPIKGRKPGNHQQAHLEFKAARRQSLPDKHENRAVYSGPTAFKSEESEAQLRSLRIPDKICHMLPSSGAARRVADRTGPELKTETAAYAERMERMCKVGGVGKTIAGRYVLIKECERKFSGIIWDVGFMPSGDVYVCYGDGIVVCGRNLETVRSLERIKLAGGAAVMNDGNIVAIDRFNDMVNIYTDTGTFLSAFAGGSSPMNVAVDSENRILVTDVGSKSVSVFNADGTTAFVIPQRGTGYDFEWPLYVGARSDRTIVVSDVLQKKVLVFDDRGGFLKVLPLKTYGGNAVLRPHGICIGGGKELFVVDNAVDTIEVFGENDTFALTVLTTDEGVTIKPKILGASKDGHLVVGGMTGIVRIYRLEDSTADDTDDDEDDVEIVKVESKNEIKKEGDSKCLDRERRKSCESKVVKPETTDSSGNDCVIIID